MKFCPVCGTEYADDIRFCARDATALKSANPSGDLIGQVIADRYHVTKKLGEGGMGAVYLAEHVKMGRKSAIKVMSASMSQDPDAVSRFNREANNASRIQHPNICAIYDFGETSDGLIYLAMEFIEGASLNDILKKSGPMSLQRATHILTQTASALKVAHDAGIVHRDLKPDNIMIAQQSGKDLVKVVDFGIAKAVGGEETGQKVTKTGLVVGTPEYMSPEQLSGDKLDGRSDLYSLALVYYRMITGTLPFVAETSQETMIKRLTDDPMPLHDAHPMGNFPPALQAVMDRALARYAAERYPDAVEFADDVQASLKGIAPEGGATMIVGADDMKTMVAGAATKNVPKTRVASAAERKGGAAAPVAEAPKSKTGLIAAAVVGVLALGGGGWAMFGRGTATPPANPPAADTTHPSQNPPATNPATTPTTTPTTNPSTTPSHPANNPQTNPGTRPNNPGTSTPSTRGAAVSKTVLDSMVDAGYDAPELRVGNITKGKAWWADRSLNADLRAEVAMMIGNMYFLDGYRQSAKAWGDSALSLTPDNATRRARVDSWTREQ